MKITFIRPNIGTMLQGTYVDEGRMEPLQLGILASLTPPGIETVLYDDRMEPIPYDIKTDLVALTVETFTAKRSYEIAGEYRKRGVPVVMGGMHPTLIPGEAAGHADAVITGDAERIWQTVLEDFRSGNLKKFYQGPFGEPQPEVLPKRELFKKKGYLKISLIQFSRGCSNSCEFCATSLFFKRSSYCRAVKDVVREIETYNLKTLFFVDDNITANPQKAKELFRALIPLKVKWVSQGALDMTEDLELMDLMEKSGCMGNVIGFESINRQNLSVMQKSPNITENFDCYKSQIKILKDYGQQTWAAFTIGHDEDTKESIRELLDFALYNKFAFAAFNVLMPYPETPLYKRLESQNRLLYDKTWWLSPDFRFNHAPFIPKNMSPGELTAAGFEARKKFNSVGSIIKRAFDRKTHMKSLYKLFIYLLYNPLFRKEVYKKQGMKLGGRKKIYE